MPKDKEQAIPLSQPFTLYPDHTTPDWPLVLTCVPYLAIRPLATTPYTVPLHPYYPQLSYYTTPGTYELFTHPASPFLTQLSSSSPTYNPWPLPLPHPFATQPPSPPPASTTSSNFGHGGRGNANNPPLLFTSFPLTPPSCCVTTPLHPFSLSPPLSFLLPVIPPLSYLLLFLFRFPYHSTPLTPFCLSILLQFSLSSNPLSSTLPSTFPLYSPPWLPSPQPLQPHPYSTLQQLFLDSLPPSSNFL